MRTHHPRHGSLMLRSGASSGIHCGVITYDDALRSRLTANLAAHERRAIDLEGRRHAAVAIVVVDSDVEAENANVASTIDDTDPKAGITGDLTELDGRMHGLAGGAAFLLCRRAAGLNRHARQWALPGGRLDPGEMPVQAALRELHEELGLPLGPESVLGVLDDYPTRSGYVITPVVVWGGGHVDIVGAPDEVAHTYRIGLHELCRDDSPRFVTIPESEHPVVQVPIGGHFIHAPTGAMLVQFRWVAIEGRLGERVDTFEQPVFAWK